MDKLNFKSKFDIFAGFAILGIVLMIIIPLPPFALDILFISKYSFISSYIITNSFFN